MNTCISCGASFEGTTGTSDQRCSRCLRRVEILKDRFDAAALMSKVTQERICVWRPVKESEHLRTSCDLTMTSHWRMTHEWFKYCPQCGGKIKEEKYAEEKGVCNAP